MKIEIKNYTRSEILTLLKKNNLSMKQFLQHIQKLGYLLHGSPKGDIEQFEPQGPGDLRVGWTTQKGIYATSNEQPIIYSLIHKDMVKGVSYLECRTVSDNKMVYGISQSIKDNNAIQPGYIYIFENEGFIENPNNPGEWVSNNLVKPIGKIPTDITDLEDPIRIVEIPSNNQDWNNYSSKYLD